MTQIHREIKQLPENSTRETHWIQTQAEITLMKDKAIFRKGLSLKRNKKALVNK